MGLLSRCDLVLNWGKVIFYQENLACKFELEAIEYIIYIESHRSVISKYFKVVRTLRDS